MEDLQLGVIETRFAEIIWKNEPVSSMELVRICEKELGWKKSTTFTVLRKLCQKGIFQNKETIVTSCMSQQEFYTRRSAKLVEDGFGDSLPAFLTAFTKQRKPSAEELAEIRRIIDSLETEIKS